MKEQDFVFSSDLAPSTLRTPNVEAKASGMLLSRRDILSFERMLCEDLKAFLPFEAHALYFPVEEEARKVVWIEEEEKILLPLRRQEQEGLLGVLMLRKPKPEMLQACLPLLPKLASLCLDKLALYKWGRTDPLTSLSSKDVLLESLTREIGQLRLDFAFGSETEANPLPLAEGSFGYGYLGTFGVIVVRVSRLRNVGRMHGQVVSEKFMRAMGAALRDILPEQALAARAGDEEFAVLVPGVGAAKLYDMACECVFKIENINLFSPLTGIPLKVRAFAGYAMFPQDWEPRMEGREEQELPAEAEWLLNKAALAALRAAESGIAPVFGYGAILSQSGLVEKSLPMSRLQTNLGRDVGAREGQRFTVWAANPDAEQEARYKGEIILADVREETSQADIVLLGDPSFPILSGDRLAMIDAEAEVFGREAEQPGKADPLTSLFRHGDFLAKLAVVREKYPEFGLALFKLQLTELPIMHGLGKQAEIEHKIAEATILLRHLLVGKANLPAASNEKSNQVWPFEEDGSFMLAGRYSLNSLLLFHPGLLPAQALQIYEPIVREMQAKLGLELAVGIACLPWLNFRASDAVECSRKALDYALLLPEPHVGVFDSLAINISADKQYSQGNIFGAIEEYRLALLADENNTLAWNSLGVCLAGVGRSGEARRAFENAVRRNPRDAAVHYNLGTVHVTMDSIPEALKEFKTCLELEPEYSFADIKLGELAERNHSLAEARVHFERAQKSDPLSPVPYRCLSRLDMLENKPDKARERLHQALLRNPQDAFSLHLMARLYLDGGEDPELAETLARQSVAFRPDRKAAWLELARALEVQGKHKDARDARVKAGTL